MSTPITRRSVLRGLALGATAPVWLRYGDAIARGADLAPAPTRRLLVVFLRGGNDSLETVSPMGNAQLQKLRPTLGLRDSDVIFMGNGYGINKALPTIAGLWKAGQAAVIQGVGTDNASFSHSVATRRWETGSNTDQFSTGWLGRYLDATPSSAAVRAAGFGDELPLTLLGAQSDAIAMKTLKEFAFSDAKSGDVKARHSALARFNASGIASPLADAALHAQQELLSVVEPINALASTPLDHPVTAGDSVAQMFGSDLGTQIGFLNVPGFDTHVGERSQHTQALMNADTEVKNFFSTAKSLNVAGESIVLVVSEFGRRVVENQSGGTDHGHGSTVLALGPGVKGGMYGAAPDFSALEDGNLPAKVDFRQVYATLLSNWLQTNPTPILDGDYTTLPFIR